MEDTIHIKLVRSPIGTKQRVRETLRGLGLGKVGSTSELKATPEVLGMLRRVNHLVYEIPDRETAGKAIAEPPVKMDPQ